MAQPTHVQTRRIDIRLHSARHLENLKGRSSKNLQTTFAHFQILLDPPAKSLARDQISSLAQNQSVNPTWNETVSITIDEFFLTDPKCFETTFLVVELHAKKKYYDGNLGQVKILLANLLNSPMTSDPVRYPVTPFHKGCCFRSPPRGEVELSIIINPPTTIPVPEIYYGAYYPTSESAGGRRGGGGAGGGFVVGGGDSDMLGGMALGFAMGYVFSKTCLPTEVGCLKHVIFVPLNV